MNFKAFVSPALAAALLALANFTPPPNGPCDSPVVGGHTGAPGETSCTGCHGGATNTGPGSLALALSDTTLRYTPGETFDATVVLRQTGRNKFGFVGLALKDAGNTTVGTFKIDDAVRTRTYNDGPRRYVSHTPCGADATPPDSLSWTFHWKAPATNVGNITLYLAGLAANHNHALSGDDTYTMTVQLVPDSVVLGTNIGLAPELSLHLWPNPVQDELRFFLPENPTGMWATIYAGDGRLVWSGRTDGAVSVAGLPLGMYMFTLSKTERGQTVTHKKFVISR